MAILKILNVGSSSNQEFYSREDAEDSVKYISGTILDDRPIRVDFDWGFQEGRQWGRGRSGGQVLCMPFIAIGLPWNFI
ncbi:unnamed protein product [Ilex paraguariensis]|uniref:Nuclear cap-binding protein subunit 2 n=1 Tax=Ilex paraguariensis TaxID=185542 RepID=A0ABC8T5Z0_9AQUA